MDRQSYADGDRSSYGKSPFDKSPILSKLHDSNLAATFTRASQNAEALPPGDGTTQRITIPRPPSTASLTISTRPQEEVIYIPGPQGENELEAPLLPARSTPNPEMEHKLQFAYTVSWIVNIALFIAKGYAFYISHSKSVLASLVDSMVDLVSQLVIFIAEYQSKKADPKFPVGKARLETLGVLACACIMSVSAYAVIQDSGSALYDGLAHDIFPELDAGWLMYAVLGAATGLKLICYILCVALQNKSDSMLALAEDHLNDIVSNVGAAATSAVAAFVADAWWADPTGGILISLFILWRWYEIAKSQLEKIVGKGAPDDMLDQLTHLVNSHHDNLSMDCLRAYHFGARYMVEAEVIMPVHFTLKEVHDISLHLQHKLEAIPEVERAFVHVDYESRPEPEHRTERILAGLPMVVEETALGSPLCKSGSGHRNHSGGGGLESHEVSGALMSKDSASANSLPRPP